MPRGRGVLGRRDGRGVAAQRVASQREGRQGDGLDIRQRHGRGRRRIGVGIRGAAVARRARVVALDRGLDHFTLAGGAPVHGESGLWVGLRGVGGLGKSVSDVWRVVNGQGQRTTVTVMRSSWMGRPKAQT